MKLPLFNLAPGVTLLEIFSNRHVYAKIRKTAQGNTRRTYAFKIDMCYFKAEQNAPFRLFQIVNESAIKKFESSWFLLLDILLTEMTHGGILEDLHNPNNKKGLTSYSRLDVWKAWALMLSRITGPVKNFNLHHNLKNLM